MKVAFDFNPVIKTRFSGFYTFGVNLFKAFNSPEFDLSVKLFYSERFQAEADALRAELDPAKFSFHPTRLHINHLKKTWEWFGFPPLQWLTGDFDLYHSFHNMMPGTRGQPRILTVHDLRRYRLPDFYNKPEQKIFTRAVQQAKRIIAVSEATRRDICDIFQVSPEKVTAVPLACDASLRPLTPEDKERRRAEVCRSLHLEPCHYLLTISATDHRKNILRTIQAYSKVKKQLPHLKLVVAGYLPKDEEELSQIRAAAERDHDIFLAGPVDDLYLLTACSEGLLFNSLYEGFGIPILEAFAMDIPVLTSNCSSMPEVGGEAALYADPQLVDEIAAGIVRLCGSERDGLVARGRERLKLFSWQLTARRTFELYHEVLSTRKDGSLRRI